MPSFKPEISVIISTYNDRAFVDKKLLEITAQTAFKRVEFIFIEPASPEGERELLEVFCQKYENCKLITLEERVSLYRAWNLGWESASAPLVCISNMDDAMHPRLLEIVLEEMLIKKWDICTALIAKQPVDDNWNLWDVLHLSELELSTRPGSFFAWKRDLMFNVGMFREELEIVGDKEFWTRIVRSKLKIGLITKVLYLYTKHPSQLSKRIEFQIKKEAENQFCRDSYCNYRWPFILRTKVRIIRYLLMLSPVRKRIKRRIYI